MVAGALYSAASRYFLILRTYWIKVYEEGSRFGINNGKISKLMLKLDGEIIANYDRGWDIKPTCEEANLALCILLSEHN